MAHRPAKLAQDVSLEDPYGVQDQESELSRRQRFGVFLGTHEQYASLTSCIRRRRASLPGGCVHPEKTTGHEVEVGPSSR